MAQAVAITDASFKSEVYESDQLVLVEFGAQWCEPCQELAPALSELAEDLADQLTVARLDVDGNPATAESYGVRSVPTLILFKNGKPAVRVVGLRSKQEIMDMLAAHLV